MVKLAMFAAGISPEWTQPPPPLIQNVQENERGTVKT